MAGWVWTTEGWQGFWPCVGGNLKDGTPKWDWWCPRCQCCQQVPYPTDRIPPIIPPEVMPAMVVYIGDRIYQMRCSMPTCRTPLEWRPWDNWPPEPD